MRLFLTVSAFVAASAFAQTQPQYNSGTISGLNARNIGSATMSGRVSAIAGYRDPQGKTTLFVGAASGGVWKSTDSGTRYKPVFDDQPVQSIGAIALDPKNPRNVWVGSGESWMRNSVSIGDGIYKSTDGGDTWTNVGLKDSEHIAKIVVSPQSSDTVYAAVPGKLWSDSTDRGLYKTTDGGKTWNVILKGANASTGCSTVEMDPSNPNNMFAAMWDFRRKGWTFRSGGDGPTAPSGSGLFHSADGGATWTEVTPENSAGFPKKPYGRLAVAIAPSNPKRVYCFVESTDSALFVSDDGGGTWEKRDKSTWMVWRPFYFANLIVDPKNPDRVFKPDGALIISEDGGKSFSTVGGFQGMHGDVHDIWIDPTNPQTVIAGDDGGIWYSYNGGAKWWKGENLPVSQFYHVSLDDQDPYRVYGGLQDNSSWVGQSEYPGGISNAQWENMYGGDGFWMWPDPSDPDYLYAEYQGGNIGRVNRYTHESRSIQPTPNYKEKLRWNWNTPVSISPTDKNTLYIGAQFLFRSRDHGQHWDRISPDLSTNDPEKQKQEQAGGVTIDNSSAEMHTTVYSISESPKDKNLIWVGTDDGNVQLTRDAGKTWTNVVGNVPGLPKNAWVSWIQASNFDPAVALAAFDMHTFGDMAPYVYRTADYGKTWTPLVTAQDAKGVRGYAHVIKEDLVKSDLLFLGTEFGLWVSIDSGKSWAQFKGGHIPPGVAVRDLAIHPRQNDLVLATHGRGIWIVDDITPLRNLKPEMLAQEGVFVAARPIQQRIEARGGWAPGDAVFVGDNPPDGAVISYYQRTRHLFGKLKLEVLDPSGKVIDELSASTRPGLNRVAWSMHEKPPRVPPGAQVSFAGTQGVRVLPGTYTVRMTKNGNVTEAKIDVGLDKRSKFSEADRKAQHDAAVKVRDLFNDESALMDRIVGLRRSVGQMAKSANDDALRKTLSDFDAKVDATRKQIVATTEGGAITGEERLREHTDQLYGAILSYEGKPGDYQLAYIDALRKELGDVSRDFDQLVTKDLPPVNDALKAKGAQPITPPQPTT